MLLLICGFQARTVVPSFNFLRLLGCSGESATVRNILKPRELRRYLTIVGRLKVARQRDIPTAVGKPVRGNVCAFPKYSEIGFKCLVPFFLFCCFVLCRDSRALGLGTVASKCHLALGRFPLVYLQQLST